MNLKLIFGEVLKEKRKEIDISQEQLALKSNLDRTFISKLERGIHQPSLESLFMIAKVLECSPTELVIQVERKLGNKDFSEL